MLGGWRSTVRMRWIDMINILLKFYYQI